MALYSLYLQTRESEDEVPDLHKDHGGMPPQEKPELQGNWVKGDPIKEVAKRTASARRYFYPARDHLTQDQGPNPTSVGYGYRTHTTDGFWEYHEKGGFVFKLWRDFPTVEWEEEDGEA